MASETIDYEMVLTKHHCVKEIQDLHLNTIYNTVLQLLKFEKFQDILN